MRKKYIFGKKLYISVLTSILVLLTTVATTFAWVGVFANSTFETFDISIVSSSLSEYNIEISADGKEFKSELSFSDFMYQILLNWGYNPADLTNEEINAVLFKKLNMDQVTTTPIMNGNYIQKLGEFKNIKGLPDSRYYKFDVYISTKKVFDGGTTSNFKMDVYLMDGLFKGTKSSYTLQNSFTYPSNFINPYTTMIVNDLITLPSGYRPILANEKIVEPRIDSASAARIAFEKYEVVQKGHPELYTDLSEPISTLIYQDSFEYPVYNEDEDLYSFGAIVPDDYNLAVGYYNSTEYRFQKYGIKSVSVPDEILNTRSVIGVSPDIRLSSKTNQIIDSSNPNEQIGVDEMMKVTISFWFEGWDADCFPALNASPVKINIGLQMTNEEEF